MTKNAGCGRLTMGHIYIEPKRVASESFWLRPDLPREGFTKYAADEMRVLVPMGDAGDRIVAERKHQLSILIGMAKAKQTGGVRHAHVVSNN